MMALSEQRAQVRNVSFASYCQRHYFLKLRSNNFDILMCLSMQDAAFTDIPWPRDMIPSSGLVGNWDEPHYLFIRNYFLP